MKRRFSIWFLICFMMLVIPFQYLHGQSSGGHVVRQECSVCGKLIKNCRYKGSHPKCSTCGKLKEDCPYKGNHPKPQPTTGTLSITSSPSDAVVKIDGKYMGTTPLTLDNQNPGIYKMTLSAEGYQTDTLSVIVSVGKTTTCSATLKQKQVSQPVAQLPVQQPVNQQINQEPTIMDNASSTSVLTFEVSGVSFNMICVECTPLGMFYIGETEVTQALWEVVMGSNPSKFKGTNRPVEKVNWNDCQIFISRLNAITGQHFRLPMEKEWEFAARGGNKSQGYKYSGSNNSDEIAWYYENSGIKHLKQITCTIGKIERNNCCTHPVKEKQPNELGIYDMSGNVWEWCADSSRSFSVIRGGSFMHGASTLRVKNRAEQLSELVVESTGLRLAM